MELIKKRVLKDIKRDGNSPTLCVRVEGNRRRILSNGKAKTLCFSVYNKSF